MIGAFTALGTKLFAGIYNMGILVSTDSGTSWRSSNNGLMDTSIINVTSMGSILLAFADSSGVFRSTDSGKSWERIHGVFSASDNDIPDFAIMGTNLFVESWNNAVFLSTDSGTNWKQAGLNNAYVDEFAVSGTNLFAGTQDGIFLSTDSGSSWKAVNQGLTDTFIQALVVSGPNLVAGTNSKGIWYRPLSQMIGSSSVAPNPSAQNSFAAFPNPLTQSTTISFTSPESGAAEITIVNLLGAKVARIYSGELDAGEHSFVWSKPPGLPPGTYWCEIRMNGMSDHIPIVVQR
jgi:hypothetical protein